MLRKAVGIFGELSKGSSFKLPLFFLENIRVVFPLLLVFFQQFIDIHVSVPSLQVFSA